MSALPTSPAFNIVLLYERTDLLHQAMATYSHLRRELGDEFTSDLHLWRIDIAATPEFAAAADLDIAAADVIVIGVRGSQACPPEFQHWRNPAPAGSRGPQRAIIAIVDGTDEPETVPGTWNGVLRGGATQIHPEIFVWEPAQESGAPAGQFKAEPAVLAER